MARLPDRPSLHVLVPPDPRIVAAVLAGGADVVQLRDKTLEAAALLEAAAPVREAVRRAGRLFVVNDFLEVAAALEADGLHVGPGDLPLAEARLRWPRPALLGASARTPERAREAVAAGADYLGTGPVFGTSTKADAPAAIGPEGLARVVRAIRGRGVPVIGIGGVGPANAAEVIAAGAGGIAVVSAVVGAADPEAATRALRNVLDRA